MGGHEIKIAQMFERVKVLSQGKQGFNILREDDGEGRRAGEYGPGGRVFIR